MKKILVQIGLTETDSLDLKFILNINQAMVTSPDGMGIIIIIGGTNRDSYEKRIIESRFDGSQFLDWQVMDQELKYPRKGHVVIPIPKSITNCN